ncbi:FadR/GntR family transcriptional regulator [Roseovarius sp. MMSF_3281]|uniref:FadR/GntR family transcriptional regulator n=1 Tax=Roseovarius sp. MMSF_3281 TaxID=3046694 RepID=UPI00273E936C|nr:FadR/GntR family transcriptional regulator [Roseovarius sp. MMSF_3281]
MLGKRESLSSQLEMELRQKIADGVYKHGDKIPTEGALCDEYGVSRTVVREAVSSLRADGLLQPRQGVGVFVNKTVKLQPFSISTIPDAQVEEIVQILELRLSTEVECAGLAALRHTDAQMTEIRDAWERIEAITSEGNANSGELDFNLHRAIARASNNRYFDKFLEFLGPQIIPRIRARTEGEDEMRPKWQADHLEVIEAIARRDADEARDAMRRHLSDSLERYRKSSIARD